MADNTLNNAGDISVALTSLTAVSVADSGGDLITNSGQISGFDAVGFANDGAPETVDNTGTIEGGSASGASAINSVGSSAGECHRRRQRRPDQSPASSMAA